jgi:electron transfer flavoprotein beta subunit
VSRNGAEAPTVRIVVLIKPGPELDESDSRAVEAALRVARRRIDVCVSVLTAGPADCVAGLRAALALGADDGVHVLEEELSTTDALALSRVLAAAVRKHGFDLALCGAESEAPNLAVVPVMLAERLGVPALCHAEAVSADATGGMGTGGAAGGEQIIALCDEGSEVVERAAEPPVLVSVTERAAAPRYPAFPAVAEARRKLISTWTPEDLGIDPATVRRRAAATVVSSTVLCTRAHTIVTAGRDAHAAAARLADFLADRRFL